MVVVAVAAAARVAAVDVAGRADGRAGAHVGRVGRRKLLLVAATAAAAAKQQQQLRQ